MVVSNFTRNSKIPTKITTRKSAPTTTNFAKGINTYKPNDLMELDELHLAQDARFDRIGEYKTRKGISALSAPIGKTEVFNNYDSESRVFYADSSKQYHLSLSNVPANSVICSIKFRVFQVIGNVYLQVNLRNTDGELLATSCFDPANFIVGDGNDEEVESQEIELYFNQAPDTPDELIVELQNQDVWNSSQKTGAHELDFLAIEETVDEDFEEDSEYGDLVCKIYTAQKGEVTSIFEANLSDSTGALTDKSVLFTFKAAGDNSGNETLYRLAENGTLTNFTTLKTDGNPVRYSQDASIIRCVYGNNLIALNPTATGSWGWQVSTIPTIDLETGTNLDIKVSNILSGPEDNLLYFDAATTSQLVWTWPYGGQYVAAASYSTTTAIPKYNPDQVTTTTIQKSALTALDATKPVSQIKLGDYVVYYKDIEGDDEKGEFYGKVTTINSNSVVVTSDPHIATALNSYDHFDRDFRQNFPTINSGDPLTAMIVIAGNVYVFTRRHKYQIAFSAVDTWDQAKCSADGGTFSQESVVSSTDRAYFANKEGIYMFDGFNEVSLTKKSIQNTYDAIPNKDKIRLEFYDNRLYVFCPSTDNTEAGVCLVYNANLDLWESFDSEQYIGAVFAQNSPSNRFICGHSRMGMLTIAESQDNNYDDLGAPIHFELDTAYLHFGSPSQLKRITKWRPEFATTDTPCLVKMGYAIDGSNDVKYAWSIDLQNMRIISNPQQMDSPSDYGVKIVPTELSTLPHIYEEFRRCQIRYQSNTAFMPVNFKSHTVTIQTQRIR